MEIEFSNWTIEERSAAQYNYFVLLGPKGMALAHPTIAMRQAEDCYSREEALSRASLASKVPQMLRLLKEVERSLEILSVDDLGAQSLLERVHAGLKSILQDPPQRRSHVQ